MIGLLAASTTYTEQAQTTQWPARIAWVLVVLALIALSLWGMRRGWRHRQERQGDIPAPMEAPPAGSVLGEAIEGLYAGTGTHGDWMDRIAVHELGVRSRARISWGPAGVWLEREGARGLFIPAGAVQEVRSDRGVSGTVRGKDSMSVITWSLGDRVLDTGFRADLTSEAATVLDGLTAEFTTGVQA